MSDISEKRSPERKSINWDDDDTFVPQHSITSLIKPVLSTILHDKFLLIGSIVLIAIPVFIVLAFILSIIVVMGHLF